MIITNEPSFSNVKPRDHGRENIDLMSTVDNWMKSETVRYHIPLFATE